MTNQNFCQAAGCLKSLVVAGPPQDRQTGWCWEHAMKWSETLGQTKPVTLLHAGGELPTETEEDFEAVIAANEAMMADVGRVIGRLL